MDETNEKKSSKPNSYHERGLYMVSTYLTNDLKKRWEKLCFNAGLSSSEYLRRLVVYEIGEKKYIEELTRIHQWTPKRKKPDIKSIKRESSNLKVINRGKKARAASQAEE